MQPADFVMAVGIAWTVAVYFRATEGAWFFVDEWLAASRGLTLGDFFEPYNGHLSVTWIAIYRGYYGIFGFDHYWVLRLVASALLCSMAALVYVTTRDRLGPLLAGIASVVVLWTPGTALDPGSMNHWITASAAVLVAWVLPRSGRRSDLVIAGLLVLALVSSGGGVAVAAACIVHTTVARSRVRRWVSVGVPAVAWFWWWAVVARQEGGLLTDPSNLVGWVNEAIFESLRLQVGGSTFVGVMAAVALVGVFSFNMVRGNRQDRASGLAWVAALVVWWVGIVSNRAGLDLTAFRYREMMVLFCVLAVAWSAPAGGSRLRVADQRIVAAVLVSLLVLVGVYREDVRQVNQTMVSNGHRSRLTAMIAAADPPVVPDFARYGFLLGSLSQLELRELLDRYDMPGRVSRQELDRALVANGALSPVVTEGSLPTLCKPVEGPVTVPPGEGLRRVTLGSRRSDVTVQVSRHGDERIDLVAMPAGSTVQIWFNGDFVVEPWTVWADGGCVVTLKP